MVRTVTVNPQTSSKDQQHHLAADGVTVHRSTIQRTLRKEMLYGRVMRKKPFLCTRHKRCRLRYAKAHLDKPASFWNKVLWTDETKIVIWAKQGALCMAEKQHSIPRKTLATYSKIWWRFHHAVGLCGQCRDWESC